jgi:hypothetical protein
MGEKEPCNRKADWVTVGEVLDGGYGFVVECNECSKRMQRTFRGWGDNLVPASVFNRELPRELRCGDEDNLYDLFSSAIAAVRNEPVTHREFAEDRLTRLMPARLLNVAIHRRFQMVEQSIGLLTSIASVAVGIVVTDEIGKFLALGGRNWAWLGIFAGVVFVVHRLITLGRLRKHLRLK